ncbi:MAG: DNA methyltransferase [Bryobacteraceae bacterium]|jgi:DNA modification methylase
MAHSSKVAGGKITSHSPALLNIDIQVEKWPIERLIPRVNNPRTHSREQVANIAASIREFGFTNPILVGADDDVIAGHARLLAAEKLAMKEVPVIVLRHLSPAQRRALVIADNQLAIAGAAWDEDMLRIELAILHEEDYPLDLVGFDDIELQRLLEAQDAAPGLTDEDAVPELQQYPVARLGDLFVLGDHRLICGDCTQPDVVARLLGDAKPLLLLTDPPYGIELDSEWRDRAGLNGCGPAEASYMKHRTEGHTETTISGDTRADWSEAFALLPDLQVGYVWHASKFTSEVLKGLLRIGFLHHQQLIWNKGRTVLTRTLYWFQHEPCWFVRKKNAPWYGKAGENSTVWDSPSPKFIMGGSDEEKFDHPTQKPMELMRRPLLNHTLPGESCYDPFLGSGTTLIAAEQTGRVCYGVELDPKYCDVIVRRWQQYTGKQAVLDGDGRPFDEIATVRAEVAA